MANNNTADVTALKGVQGGYGFSAVAGTTAPTDFTSLAAAFKNMGFISSDGISESIDIDSEEVTDLNGETVCVLESKETEKLTFTLISTSDDALKEMHGHANVSTASNITTVQHKAGSFTERVYVFDLLTKDGNKWRKVAPNAKVTNRGEIIHGAGNVYAREIELTCSPDASGVRVYDYIQRPSA
ncbi:MAG: hypothetical protein IIZ12_01405 [Eggerthellaceae bacterium]|nr:hypothetical protein [Eggerthellaceae bacterium]